MENPRGSKNEKTEIEHTRKVIYSTWSVCPRCALVDRKGIEQKPAQVYELDSKIWISVECKTHGAHTTLYCSNAEFFHKTLEYTFDLDPNPLSNKPQDLPDLEEMKEKLKYSPHSTNLPLTIEFSLWENGELLADEDIKHRVEEIQHTWPKHRQFILKVVAKITMDIPKLNAKLLALEALVPGNLLIVETSYERLCLLCREKDSIFLKPSVFPALKYYLRSGDEPECKKELTHLFDYLKTFSEMQLMVTISICRPYPSLTEIIKFMREQYGFIRLIVISMERSLKELSNCLEHNIAKGNYFAEKKSETGQELNHAESVDVYELLEHVQTSFGNSVCVDDFYPMSLAASMEPFLSVMGYGFYSIRPNPFCGYWTCLVNTEKTFYSYPVTRLFDFGKIFQEMKGILPRLQDGKIGLFNARKLKKIFHESVFPNKGELPDLYAYLTDKSLAETTRKFIQNLQFVVVHNNMDLGAMDFHRRCNCTMVQSSKMASATNGFVSCCSGCL